MTNRFLDQDRSAIVGIYTLLVAALLGVMVLGMMTGAVHLGFSQIVEALSGGKNSFIVSHYRAPRVLVSVLAGGSLGIAGVFLQGALRNPLASPDVVGITKWAGLGAFLTALWTPSAWSTWSIPLGVIIGAILGAVLLLAIGRSFGRGASVLALVGIALGLLCQSLMQYFMVIFPTRADQSMVWLAGSVYGSTMPDVYALAIWLMVCLPFVFIASRRLQSAGFGDDTLTSLGISPTRLRGSFILISVLLSAGAVAAVGSMGFLGLLAPHAARLLGGSGSRNLVVISALIGAITLASADLIGRLIALPNEIPAGIVAAMIGGPYLIFLLIKEARTSHAG